MNKVKINHTNLEVSRINFGGNVFGWTLNEAEAFNMLDKFYDSGFNFIDTADTYSWWAEGNSGGESETIIGNWHRKRGNRSELVIATKVGSATNKQPKDVSRKHILKSVDESLKRLKTDYIDLYYTHFDDELTPVEETLTIYDELIKAGKVRYIGASNMSPERLRESLEFSKANYLASYIALQPHYNLVERSLFENNYAAIAKDYKLAVMPYYALASGFLTGKYRSEPDLIKSVRGAGASKYLDEKGLTVLNALDTVASKHHTKPATVALAWLLANPLIVAPVVSATNHDQLKTLLEAPELLLDASDLELLNNSSMK